MPLILAGLIGIIAGGAGALKLTEPEAPEAAPMPGEVPQLTTAGLAVWALAGVGAFMVARRVLK